MSKLKNPLFSLSGKGGLGKAVSFVKRGGRSIAEKHPEIPDARTLLQQSWRHMYQKAVALWQALSAAEKQEWESLARPKHMTGFAWFVSQALKPNPGLYLPLQGGKMAGDIDMDGHGICDLPDPTLDQEPATKKYHDDNLPVGGYTEGCKIHHNAHQSIPDNTWTVLNFNEEFYDTDEMHDPLVDNHLIHIKTAGIYLIVFQGAFDNNATGYRRAYIRQNGAYAIQIRQDAEPTQRTTFNLTTIVQVAIGDYLRIQVLQTSGAPLNLEHGLSYSPVFMAQRIG